LIQPFDQDHQTLVVVVVVEKEETVVVEKEENISVLECPKSYFIFVVVVN
jgi:hypothetical protein